jgi:Flp pilus assembly pilin Flp
MSNLVVRFLREESGEDLIEYGLLCAFVAAVATAIIIADPLGIRSSLISAYMKAKTALSNS